MKPRQLIQLLHPLLGVGLSLFVGCTLLPSNDISTSDPSVAASGASPSQTASPTLSPGQQRPDTRIVPMAIEGEMIEMELELFDQSPLPFTTYVPTNDFQNEVNSSKQGTVAQFFFSPTGKKDEAAYVQIFLPARYTSIEDMRELLLSDQGLLATNNWQLVDRTDIVSYPWAREKLIYQQQVKEQNFVGSIYIGDYQGRAFYALTHYPAEYVDGFEPRSTIMLENLQFRDENS
ncbi:MAG: hypothetical protein HC827_00180 [Cyanobacteria bacterium RM1_2_2]|nr:hypothetical protein [Cyanobacteria bacterium RM1_2_2]